MKDRWIEDMEEESDGEREEKGNEEEMKRDLREERPSNTPDGREAREFELRLMEQKRNEGKRLKMR